MPPGLPDSGQYPNSFGRRSCHRAILKAILCRSTTTQRVIPEIGRDALIWPVRATPFRRAKIGKSATYRILRGLGSQTAAPNVDRAAGSARHQNCMQRRWQPMSLIELEKSRSEVITTMKDRFSSTELTALRNDLLQGGLID